MKRAKVNGKMDVRIEETYDTFSFSDVNPEDVLGDSWFTKGYRPDLAIGMRISIKGEMQEAEEVMGRLLEGAENLQRLKLEHDGSREIDWFSKVTFVLLSLAELEVKATAFEGLRRAMPSLRTLRLDVTDKEYENGDLILRWKHEMDHIPELGFCGPTFFPQEQIQ